MTEALEQWQGRVLDIRFPLRESLGGSESSSVFVTEHSEPDPQKAVIKLGRVNPSRARRELNRAESAARLSHSALIRIFQVGLWRCEDQCLLYTVMEYAPENLAQILPERPLTESEMRQVLFSMLDALAYIHQTGFVHGHLKPANIMAVDDQIRISCDGLYRIGDSLDPRKPNVYDPPEALNGTLTPAGDVWALAVTMVEALTQQLPAWEGTERQLILPAMLRSPFSDIAQNCLRMAPELRWTIDNIADRLRPDSEPVRSVDVRLESSSIQHRSVPWMISIMLAAILIGGKIFYPHSNAQRSVSPLREQIGTGSVSKQVPLQSVQGQPRNHERRPSPFEPVQASRKMSAKLGFRGTTKDRGATVFHDPSPVQETRRLIGETPDARVPKPMPHDAEGTAHQNVVAASGAERHMTGSENETGRASFFSSSANGGLTASGTRLNSEKLIAAHPRYPLGSRVRVTRISNGKTIEVQIVDRFPDGSKRIINVSEAAARELGFTEEGTAVVRLELVRRNVGP